ncbi:Lathosterol oxidase [Borealophlyctis nickersoniae]|nr:Lathosterol oxidase [Borealophlyctis nickersoniae]
MDIVLDAANPIVFNPLYSIFPSSLQPFYADPTHAARQLTSLFLIALTGSFIIYLTVASLSYFFTFDPSAKTDPLYLPRQISREIRLSLSSLPALAVFTVPWFFGELRGYSRLYDDVGDRGWAYFAVSVPLFLVFTDTLIYFIHAALHQPVLYARIHKPHHTWKVPTPFASHAFHPVDGALQSLPYHLFVYIFPLHKGLYIALFLAVNVWTISIHDGVYLTEHPLVNGASHHTIHHLQFKYNYGQYFTIWDRICGTYRGPDHPSADKKTKEM